jgi:RimJ/RimL family protein N-acetyltransferase
VSEQRVTLRPVRDADLGYFDDWTDPADDPFSFFGLHPAGHVRRRFAEDGLLTTDSATLLVEADGAVVGDVGWRAVHYGGFGMSRAAEIGIRLLPDRRGLGHGRAAQRALVGYLFDTTTINRVQASTDIENIAEQKALEHAGFTREGVLRGAQWRAGAWHDLVMYSQLRGER